jgi:CRP-like cAMP-binding protein
MNSMGLLLTVCATNSVLAAVPDDRCETLLTRGQLFSFERGDMLARPGEPVEHVAFPLTGLAAVQANVGSGRHVVVALVGRTGAIGLESLLGPGSCATGRVVGIIPGQALRVPADAIRRAAVGSAAVNRVLRAAASCQALELGQIAACNARHSLESRLARWVLAIHEMLDGGDLPITHQFLATALGVRRAGVTGTMGAFQAAGLLRQGRAHVVVLDRPGLERTVCSCHGELRERRKSIWAESAVGATEERNNVAASQALREIQALRSGETNPEQRAELILRACRNVVDWCRSALETA